MYYNEKIDHSLILNNFVKTMASNSIVNDSSLYTANNSEKTKKLTEKIKKMILEGKTDGYIRDRLNFRKKDEKNKEIAEEIIKQLRKDQKQNYCIIEETSV
jgi:hypothetical protein